MNNKKLNQLVRLKEKRTFVLNVQCDCGGEMVYDVGDVSSIFSSLFSTINSEKNAMEFNHKCRKCGKTAKFNHIFPCEKSFEIGLDTPNNSIAEYVSEAFEEELKDAVGYSKSAEI